MNETPQEYSTRILGYLKGKNSLTVLAESPKKIKKLISGKSKKILYKKPHPSKWSAAEIIAHLAETELVLGWRYRSIAENNGVLIQSFEQDLWAENAQYYKLDVKEMLEMFSILRKANITFLKNLTKEKFKNYGMHRERGKETIEHIVNLEAGHDVNHLNQIIAILKK